LKQKRRTIKEIRLEIEQSLIKRTKKLVIVIDDIERLTPEQAKTIFQIVKSNANFPNSVFFLVFEKDILLKNLLHEKISREYLHKIIQVYFDIPEVGPNKVQQYLFKELDSILNQELPPNYEFDSEYWSNIYHR
jgi:predicted KAP-like P-loop ATPase